MKCIEEGFNLLVISKYSSTFSPLLMYSFGTLFQANYASHHLSSLRGSPGAQHSIYGISILFISPIKIRVLDRALFWILYSSLKERTIEMGNEIKFLIMNSFIHPWQERLSCFDCKHWNPYVFSDWPKAYSEFSKSAPVTSSTCRCRLAVYNNHVKDTQGHEQLCHVDHSANKPDRAEIKEKTLVSKWEVHNLLKENAFALKEHGIFCDWPLEYLGKGGFTVSNMN